MTKVKLMLLAFYHLGLDLVTEDIYDAIAVMELAHEIEPFADGEEAGLFMAALFFDDGVPNELIIRVEKAGMKWYWWNVTIGFLTQAETI